jgi:integration host factor subunit beta
MTKAELIEAVAVRCKMQLDPAQVVVDAFFDSLIVALTDGRRVEIRGFGSFQVKDYDGYMGRNPRTGDPVTVPPKRLPVFKVGKGLERAVDGGRNV